MKKERKKERKKEENQELEAAGLLGYGGLKTCVHNNSHMKGID